MLVSTKGRYALRVMIDLAGHNDGSLVRLQDIADRQQISEKYLEGILSVLSKANLVISSRGKGGGYRLSRPSAEYTACQIIETIEGRIAPISCLKAPGKHLRTQAVLLHSSHVGTAGSSDPGLSAERNP